MSKGKGKGQPQLSRGQRFEVLEKTVKQLETAVRIGQMLQQQIGNSIGPMQQDLQAIAPQMQEAQYQLLAMRKMLNIDKDELATVANDLRLKDYNDASDKEDADNKYTVKDTIDNETDIVILSSTTPDEDEDKGIFRSKVAVSATGPELTEKLVGKKVDDVVEHDLNGVKHVLKVIGVREVPPAPEPEAPQAQPDQPLDIVGENAEEGQPEA